MVLKVINLVRKLMQLYQENARLPRFMLPLFLQSYTQLESGLEDPVLLHVLESH